MIPRLLPYARNLFLFGATQLAVNAAAEPSKDSELALIHSQPSFVLSSKEVELSVTQHGAQMAPVKFFRNTAQPVSPYYVSPWQDEAPTKMPAPVLDALRGDFFCMPFGGNGEAVGGNGEAVPSEKHPPHGEIVGSTWRRAGVKQAGDVTTLTIVADTQIRKGRVTKELSLVAGQNIIYSTNTIEGFAGKTPLGHHATLAMPEKEGAVQIATSAFRFGMTCPSVFSDPRQREYQALLPGAKWTDLRRVPVAWKGAPAADLTRMPGRHGFADLVQLVNKPASKKNWPAWTTATYSESGYVWFSLKDPAVLNSTVLWMENHGRHGHPWNGRNNCLGLEDVTAYFAEGVAASCAPNALTKKGVATAVELSAAKPTSVHYIQGVVRVPEGFEKVRTLEFAPGEVTFVSTSGHKVKTAVRHEFLSTGKL